MSRPEEHPDCRPVDHPEHLPWPPELPNPYPYPLTEPFPDLWIKELQETITSEIAFNEDLAREKFGDAYITQLMSNQPVFSGDWFQLAYLLRCHEKAMEQRVQGIGRNKICDCPFCIQLWDQIHLEHAILWDKHLEYVRLNDAHFENVELIGAHLEYASLVFAHIEHANLQNTNLEHADLSNAHLEYAKFINAHLEHAEFRNANLEHADFWNAHLEHAEFRNANLEHAILAGANLEHANLQRADFTDAQLYLARFNHADVRRATGLIFNSNEVDRMRIEGNAPDPWSVLRRSYTGPWFFFHLVMLCVFILPYAGHVIFLTWEDQALRRLDQFHENLKSPMPTVEQSESSAQGNLEEHIIEPLKKLMVKTQSRRVGKTKEVSALH